MSNFETIASFKAWLVSATLSLLALPVQALVVLQYHHISDDTPKATSTSTGLFEEHLDYLVDNGFDVIGVDSLARLLRNGEPLPDKTAVITFDDGYRSVFEEAWPRLRERGLPFAVFINTQPHDQNNPAFMTWEQMQQMADAGVIFANHTVSHPHLIRRLQGESEAEWRERVRAEILQAEKRIKAKLDQNHRLLAYPFGEYNQELQRLLRQEGFLAFGQQSGPVAQHSHPQALPRFPFGGIYGRMKSFTTKVNTRAMPLTDIRVLSDKGAVLKEPELPPDVERPQLRLELQDPALARQLNCFASGQGAIPTRVDGRQVTARAPEPLPVGRSRYNCTAPTAEKGRFYWYSAPFIRRRPDHSWYQE